MNRRKKKLFFLTERENTPAPALLKCSDTEPFSLFTEQFGASARTIEDRVRYRGFSQWEMMGIAPILAKFCHAEVADIPSWWRTIDTEHRILFMDKMSRFGMCTNTVRTRFATGNFKTWEMMGIRECVRLYKKAKREADSSVQRP